MKKPEARLSKAVEAMQAAEQMRDEAIVELMRRGAKFADLTRLTGLGQKSLRTIAARAGLPKRPQGRPRKDLIH
jgi:hypothetical protein